MAQNIAELEAKLTLDLSNFQASINSLNNLVSGATMTVGKMATAFAAAEVGVGSLGEAFRAIQSAVLGFNSTIERATLSFTYLLGSADAAREHIALLMGMAETSPFPVEQYLAASRALQGFGMQAQFVPSVLRQISDAAAAMNVPLDSAVEAIGRFMTMIARGQTGAGGAGMSMAGRGLLSMGLISGPMMQQLASMQQAGASAQDIIDKFLGSLGKFGGAAEAAASTWSGLMVRIKDSLATLAGDAFQPLFLVLEQLAKAFQESLGTDATKSAMRDFGLATLGVLEGVTMGVLQVYGAFEELGNFFKPASTFYTNTMTWAQNFGARVNQMFGALGIAIPTLGGLTGGGAVSSSSPLGIAGGMTPPSTREDRATAAFQAARMQAQQYGAPQAKAGGGGAAPSGLMFGPPPGATPQQMDALAQAKRVLDDLNPTISDVTKEAEKLSLQFDQLALHAGPLAGQIKALKGEALANFEVWKVQGEMLKELNTQITAFRSGEAAGAVMGMGSFRLSSGAVPGILSTAQSQLGQITPSQGPLEAAGADVKTLTATVDALAKVMGADSDIVAVWTNKLSDAREALQALQTAGLTAAANVQTMVTGDAAAAQSEEQLRVAAEDVNNSLMRLSDTAKIMGPGFDQAGASVKILQSALEAANSGAIPQTVAQIKSMNDQLASAKGMELFKGTVDDVFTGIRTALDTTVKGITLGTTTMSQAFANLGQNILLTIEEVLIKQAFTQLQKAFTDMLDSMDARAAISTALKYFSQFFSSTPGVSPADVSATGFGPAAEAPAVSTGAIGLVQGLQSGGVVTQPTFAMVGEHGPEAVIPLDRLQPGGGGGVNITVINNNGSDVQTQDQGTANGQRQILLMIDNRVQQGLAGGTYDKTLSTLFGVTRQGAGR